MGTYSCGDVAEPAAAEFEGDHRLDGPVGEVVFIAARAEDLFDSVPVSPATGELEGDALDWDVATPDD